MSTTFIFFIRVFPNKHLGFLLGYGEKSILSDVYPDYDSFYNKTMKAVGDVMALIYSCNTLVDIWGSRFFSVRVEFKRNLLDMHFTYIKYSVQIGTMYENIRTCQLCAVSKDELSEGGILDFIILSRGAFPKKQQVENQEHSNEIILKGMKTVFSPSNCLY